MDTTSPALEARSLTKAYGHTRGIVDADLRLEAGDVLGLVGANGVGKTTLMRTLLDFIRPSSGSISAFGHDSVLESVAVRRLTAYLPGELSDTVGWLHALRALTLWRWYLENDPLASGLGWPEIAVLGECA